MHKLEPIRKNHDFGVTLLPLREIISWKLLRPVPDFMILKTKSPYLQRRPQKNKNSTRLTLQSKSKKIMVDYEGWCQKCSIKMGGMLAKTAECYIKVYQKKMEYRRKWLAGTGVVMGATITGGTLVMGGTSNPHIHFGFHAFYYCHKGKSVEKPFGICYMQTGLVGIYAFQIRIKRFWKELGRDEMNLDHPGLWTAVESMRRKKLIADGSVQPSLLYLPGSTCLRHQRWVVQSSPPPPSYRPPSLPPFVPHDIVPILPTIQLSYSSYLMTNL